jgi:hypothetical protein
VNTRRSWSSSRRRILTKRNFVLCTLIFDVAAKLRGLNDVARILLNAEDVSESEPGVASTPGHKDLLVINIEDVREWISEHFQCSEMWGEL